MKSNMDMYIYSSYWGKWSRRISNNHPTGPFVEVNLTPINHCHDSSWENNVAPAIIRKHGTAPFSGDIKTDELPKDVWDAMVKHLGAEKTEFLMDYDFLPEIDWEKWAKYNNGGCAFEKCKKE